MQAYERLEQELARWIGVEDVVACSSGTAALHLALESLMLPPGSGVLIPDLTMVAVARAVTLAGLTPILVDCDEGLNIDATFVQAAIDDACIEDGATWKPERRISAIIAVSTYGREYDVFRVRKATENYGLRVIEDMAELHGKKPSYNADAACYSFYKNKIVGGEEGGCIVFGDVRGLSPLATSHHARMIRSLGFTAAHDFMHVGRGHNYRLANCLAEKISESLTRYEDNVRRRRWIESTYDALCPAEWKMPKRDVPWVYDLRIRGMMSGRQDDLVRRLQAAGVAARHCFKPMSIQPEYRSCRLFGNGNAAVASREVIYLPLDPSQPADLPFRAFEVLKNAV